MAKKNSKPASPPRRQTKHSVNEQRQPTDDFKRLVASFNEGRLDSAEELALTLAKAYPQHPFIWKALGAIYQKLGRIEQALAAKQRSVQLATSDPEAYNNLGVCYQDLQRFKEAEASFRQAIHLNPQFCEAYSNLGATLLRLGQDREAELACRQAISLNPAFAQSHTNLGLVLHEVGRLPEAEAAHRYAIRCHPNFEKAHSNLGIVLQSMGRLFDAASAHRDAIRINPSYDKAHSNLGIVLQELGHFTEADQCYREALRINPAYDKAFSNLLFNQNYMPDLDPMSAKKEACRYGQGVSNRCSPKFTEWHAHAKAAKLRIGFVSGDFRNHPVGYFIEGLLKEIDRQAFELIAYPTTPKTDANTQNLRPLFDEWHPIYGMSDFDAAKRIHSQALHVLIDLAGHSEHNRLPVFSYKPAPVQASWLGYFATTGLPEMDYFVGDPIMCPDSEQAHFIEKILPLPEIWLSCAQPQGAKPASLPALRNGYITFGAMGNLAKMNADVLNVWANILLRVPGAKLLLKSSQLADLQVIKSVKDTFQKYGVTDGQLVFEGPSPREDYLLAYNKIDFVLDTFPYPGGTTSVDAAAMGVPVLTLRGSRFLSRLGESIAHNLGSEAWIANDKNEYIMKAIQYASDFSTLASMRKHFRETSKNASIFDPPRFAKGFEDIIRQISAHAHKN